MAIDSRIRYLHGSDTEMDVGSILRPRGADYEADWSHAPFYKALEAYRPSGALAHKDAIFMVDNADDVDLASGGAKFLFDLRPLGPVSRHDLNWSSVIAALLDEGVPSSDEAVRAAAESYWRGDPSPNETIWEYLTNEAEILSVEPYDELGISP